MSGQRPVPDPAGGARGCTIEQLELRLEELEAEHRRCIADPRCSLIFAISLVAEPRELPAPRSYPNRFPL